MVAVVEVVVVVCDIGHNRCGIVSSGGLFRCVWVVSAGSFGAAGGNSPGVLFFFGLCFVQGKIIVQVDGPSAPGKPRTVRVRVRSSRAKLGRSVR